jgi:porin
MLFTTHVAAAADAGGDADSADDNAHELAAVYTADLWRNTRGGLRTGNAYLDNLDLTLAVDAQRAWGLAGVSAFVHALYNNSARFSERYVGDAMTVSNIDAPQAVRLYEAWLQWESAATHALSLRLGLYDLNSEFDMSDSRSLFLHSSHGVGHELGQTGENGPSIFPVTSLAVRAAWSPAPQWRVLLAVFDGVPGDPEHPSSNRIRVNSDEGALGIAELQWTGERVTKLSLGNWHYTADDNRGTYAGVEVALDREPGDEPATLAFARYGAAEHRSNEFADSWSIGVRHRGLLHARPDDEIGIGYTRADVSSAFGETRDGYEAAIELTYRAALTDWLTIQPDIQFIFNPGADPALDDSLAIGLRLEFSADALR